MSIIFYNSYYEPSGKITFSVSNYDILNNITSVNFNLKIKFFVFLDLEIINGRPSKC